MTTVSTLSRRGKSYQEAAKLIDKDKSYGPVEALELLKETARAKFDETVELHLRTRADPRHADQLIRSVVMLPHGTGKAQRVLVFAQGEAATIAREAGADIIADDEIIQRIDKEGWTEFDVAIATQDMMGRIGRLGRTLGRRGLMPSPRSGTVVQAQDIPRAVDEAKRGRQEFRMDRTGNIHVAIGTVSFDTEALSDNLAATMDAVVRARPDGIKGDLFKNISLTTTMGPSVRLDIAQTQALRVA
jgi:large subunit ribosomal protein L1